MKQSLLGTVLVCTAALAVTGCATKKYVRQQVDPVSQQVQTVQNQSNQQGQSLEATRRDVEHNETAISAASETAKGADARATDALNAANTAGSKADQANRNIDELRSTVANLDDYKPAGNATVEFKFNRSNLTPDAQAELDKLASNLQYKRYFVAVEGFTDRTGTAAYNDELSRKRADEVVKYLVAKYNVPVYRIHEVGLGKDKPADDGRGRAANAKNRRVEVTVYSADSAMAQNNAAGAAPVPQQ